VATSFCQIPVLHTYDFSYLQRMSQRHRFFRSNHKWTTPLSVGTAHYPWFSIFGGKICVRRGERSEGHVGRQTLTALYGSVLLIHLTQDRMDPACSSIWHRTGTSGGFLRIPVFWNVTPCNLIIFSVQKMAGCRVLWNVGTDLPIYVSPHPKRQRLEYSVLQLLKKGSAPRSQLRLTRDFPDVIADKRKYLPMIYLYRSLLVAFLLMGSKSL
jgi:hypothetical protein